MISAGSTKRTCGEQFELRNYTNVHKKKKRKISKANKLCKSKVGSNQVLNTSALSSSLLCFFCFHMLDTVMWRNEDRSEQKGFVFFSFFLCFPLPFLWFLTFRLLFYKGKTWDKKRKYKENLKTARTKLYYVLLHRNANRSLKHFYILLLALLFITYILEAQWCGR